MCDGLQMEVRLRDWRVVCPQLAMLILSLGASVACVDKCAGAEGIGPQVVYAPDLGKSWIVPIDALAKFPLSSP
jgi:hypothetical protein